MRSGPRWRLAPSVHAACCVTVETGLPLGATVAACADVQKPRFFMLANRFSCSFVPSQIHFLPALWLVSFPSDRFFSRDNYTDAHRQQHNITPTSIRVFKVSPTPSSCSLSSSSTSRGITCKRLEDRVWPVLLLVCAFGPPLPCVRAYPG